MTIYYTDEFTALDSSLIWDVWYNEASNTAYLSVRGSVYRYENVPLDAVQSLVDAPSIGRAYTGTIWGLGFKQKFGPGKRLEEPYDFVYKHEVAAVPARAKNLVYSENATVTPIRVPLEVVEDTASSDEAIATRNKMTVHFESNGSRTHTLEAATIDEAVAEVNKVADMLGVTLRVTGVFVHLG